MTKLEMIEEIKKFDFYVNMMININNEKKLFIKSLLLEKFIKEISGIHFFDKKENAELFPFIIRKLFREFVPSIRVELDIDCEIETPSISYGGKIRLYTNTIICLSFYEIKIINDVIFTKHLYSTKLSFDVGSRDNENEDIKRNTFVYFEQKQSNTNVAPYYIGKIDFECNEIEIIYYNELFYDKISSDLLEILSGKGYKSFEISNVMDFITTDGAQRGFIKFLE